MFTRKIASNTFAARPDIIRFQRLAILRESVMNCISNSGTAAPSSVGDCVHQFEVSKDEDGAGHGEMANICFTAIHSCTLRHLRHLVTLPRTGGRVHRLSAWTELRRVHLFEHEREIKDEMFSSQPCYKLPYVAASIRKYRLITPGVRRRTSPVAPSCTPAVGRWSAYNTGL